MVVGTSGSADERWGVLTASATSLPSRMKGSAVAMVEQVKSTRPDIISVSISGITRNGTCKASKPALKRNISAEMWVAEPTPAVPNVIEPGLAEFRQRPQFRHRLACGQTWCHAHCGRKHLRRNVRNWRKQT